MQLDSGIEVCARPFIEGVPAGDREELEIGLMVFERLLSLNGALGFARIAVLELGHLRNEGLANAQCGGDDLGGDAQRLRMRLGREPDGGAKRRRASRRRCRARRREARRQSARGERFNGCELIFQHRLIELSGVRLHQSGVTFSEEIVEGPNQIGEESARMRKSLEEAIRSVKKNRTFLKQRTVPKSAPARKMHASTAKTVQRGPLIPGIELEEELGQRRLLGRLSRLDGRELSALCGEGAAPPRRLDALGLSRGGRARSRASPGLA